MGESRKIDFDLLYRSITKMKETLESCRKNTFPNSAYLNQMRVRLFPKFAIWGLAILFFGTQMSLFLDTSLAQTSDKLTIGWIEKVQILPQNILLHAKIDTGADTSSLNVTELSEFVRNSKRWVQFTVTTREGQRVRLKKRVVRHVRIKRKGAQAQRRPVVRFDICLASIFKPNTQVNLTDRKNFKYNMLIGRSFLRDLAIVDSSFTYSQDPDCLEK